MRILHVVVILVSAHSKLRLLSNGTNEHIKFDQNSTVVAIILKKYNVSIAHNVIIINSLHLDELKKLTKLCYVK